MTTPDLLGIELEAPRPPPSELWRPARLDIAAGWVTGHGLHDEARPTARETGACSPAEALDEALVGALASPPCLVAFSGGRDSSLLLAAAVRAARRHGLEPPVAVTRRFPGSPETDETEWQELVVRHVGGVEWIRLTYGFAELDVVGPIAAEGLRAHGVLWPPLVHTWRPIEALADGGCIVTGEGGDDLLTGRRSSALAHVVRSRRLRRRVLPPLLRSAAPRSLRRRQLKRELEATAARRWLRPEAREVLIARQLDDELSEPFRWDRSLDWLGGRRTWRMGAHNRNVIARRAGTRYVDPLHDPRVVAALKRAGGAIGWPSRSALLRALFADLLPDAVLARRNKVAFNSVMFSEHTRELIRRWTGEGVDESLVDPRTLAELWARGAPPAATVMLLQSVFLAAGP